MRRTNLHRCGVVMLSLFTGWQAAVRGEDAPLIPQVLLRSIPNDTLAVYVHGGPAGGATPGDALSVLDWGALAVDRVQEMGVLSNIDSCARMWLDSLTAVNTGFKYPHALALLDIKVRSRDDGGHELDRLTAALLIRIGESSEAVERRIQHLLNVYTNTSESNLTVQTEHGGKRYILRDGRLPDWAVLSWGRLNDIYLITIGEGAFERIERAYGDHNASLLANQWFTSAFLRANGSKAVFTCFVEVDRLRTGSGPAFAKKVESVRNALGLADVVRGLWTTWRSERSLEIRAFLNRQDQDVLVEIAGERHLARLGGQVLPAEATRFAVFNGRAGDVTRRIGDAYLASCGPESQAESRTFWGGIESRSKVSFDRDLFDHLGSPFIIHDDPPHPLRLPFARTILVRVDGDAAALRRSIDGLLSSIQKTFLDDSWYKLGRDDDGMWSLQLGVLAPAMMVTDDWLVVSHSPFAVRKNIDILAPTSNTEPGHPASSPASKEPSASSTE